MCLFPFRKGTGVGLTKYDYCSYYDNYIKPYASPSNHHCRSLSELAHSIRNAILSSDVIAIRVRVNLIMRKEQGSGCA